LSYACPEVFGNSSNGVALETAREIGFRLGYIEKFSGTRDCISWSYDSSSCRLVVMVQVGTSVLFGGSRLGNCG